MNKETLKKVIALNDEIKKLKQSINIFDNKKKLRIQAFYDGCNGYDCWFDCCEIDDDLRAVIYNVLKDKLKKLEKELEEL